MKTTSSKTVLSRLLRAALPLALAGALAGCGESPQLAASYEAGKYQGKSDTRPWESAAYGGDKARWESDMRARAGNQSELRRTAD